jgi:predicted nucleic acid-binding Zn ribbon protein
MKNKEKTHCIHGHEFTEDNTYVSPKGHRYCRTCKNKRQKRYSNPAVPSLANCRECGEPIPYGSKRSQFCSDSCQKIGHADRAKARLLAKNYGITVEELEKLRLFQDNKCAICKYDLVSGKFAVDHDHVTGITRGLLCWWCNHKLLPAARDNIDTLISAANYLTNPPAVSFLGIKVGYDPVLKGKKKAKRQKKKSL